jgi:hypothetical protein
LLAAGRSAYRRVLLIRAAQRRVCKGALGADGTAQRQLLGELERRYGDILVRFRFLLLASCWSASAASSCWLQRVQHRPLCTCAAALLGQLVRRTLVDVVVVLLFVLLHIHAAAAVAVGARLLPFFRCDGCCCVCFAMRIMRWTACAMRC